MENQLLPEREQAAELNPNQKRSLQLPIFALIFSLLPYLSVVLGVLGIGDIGLVLLFTVLSPILSLTAGIGALCQGKKKIGMLGIVLSVIALSLAVFLIGVIIAIIIGASTGALSLM